MKERPLGLICIALAILFWNFFAALGEEQDEKERQTFVVRYKSGDQTIPVTVVLDYKKQTEYVINMNNRSPAKSVTLYDFKQRTIAYKDLTNRECFLGSLSHETLNEESEALQFVKNPVEVQSTKVLSLDPDRQAMTPTEIRNIAGQKTAVFCRKMTTWMLKPTNQTHTLHKRDLENEEEVEERSYGHHGFHTVQYSHYGHQTRRRYRRPVHGKSKRKTQHGHPEASTLRPNHIRRTPSWKHTTNNEFDNFSENLNNQSNDDRNRFFPSMQNLHSGNYHSSSDENAISHSLNAQQSHPYFRNHDHHVNYSPHDHLQKSESHHNLNFEPLFNNQENHYPQSVSNIFPINHRQKLNQSDDDDYKNDHFDDASLNATVSNPSGVITRSERETTPVDIFQYHFFSNSNDSLGEKSLSSPRPEEDIKYDPSDFHGEIESNVLPLDYSQNYYPYHNNVPVLDLESHFSSSNDKDTFRKGLQNYDDLYSTDNPEFSNNVLEIPKITAKFENLHRQNATEFVSYENQSRSHNTVSHETVNPNSDKLQSSNIEIHQKENQLPITNDHFYPYQSTEKNLLLNENNPGIFSTPLNSLSLPSTTETVLEEYTIKNFKFLPNRNANKDESKFSSGNLGTNKSHENRPTMKYRHFINTVNPNRSFLNVNENNRSRFQNEHAEIDRTFSTTNNYNTFSTTAQPFLTSTTSYDISQHHQARFDNVLKLFKPDEIIINVEKLPTHSPTESLSSFNHKRPFLHTNSRHSAVQIPILPFRAAPTETTQPPRTAEPLQVTAPTTLSPTQQLNHSRIRSHSEQASSSIHLTSHYRNAGVVSGRRNHQKRKHTETGSFPYASNKLSQERRNSSTQYAQSHRTIQRRVYPHPVGVVNQPSKAHPFRSSSQQHSHLNALPPGVSMHPRHPQAPYADMVHSNVLHSLPDEQRYRHGKPHRQRHHRRKDRLSSPCCKGRGAACCSTSGSRTYQGANCCSSAKNFGHKQRIPSFSRRTPTRSNGFLNDSSRNFVDNRDRCQKEKMCRTLYESTQQVMVCRNAAVDGC